MSAAGEAQARRARCRAKATEADTLRNRLHILHNEAEA
jgi:hypothetical protein